MVAKSYGFTFAIIILFVKSSHTLCAICVQFNRSIINLTHSLQFHVIAPNACVVLARTILFDALISDEHSEVLLA